MQAKRIRNDGVLLTGHKAPAVEILFDPEREWGIHEEPLAAGRRGYPVEVLLNGIRFRSVIVSRMRRLFVLVDEGMARRAGAAAGDTVRLTVWPDAAARSRPARGEAG